ncbi:radical SAM protein [Chitinibacter sp. SCUT-21]|uniref:radical SAM protein n=1 Tax=Chitinibacter sp. SCUT-21 TaxID=2970891 RepID=UPI0035A73F0D
MSIQISSPLSVSDHRRDIAGLKYVYPVISRRAGGVSIGINLNPNNACNWRCVYCQVPDLVRGSAPEIDLQQLELELDLMLNQIVYGDFMATAVPPEAQRLNDIAFSGNGEPTTSKQFLAACELVAAARQKYNLDVKTVVITNGSQLDKPQVQMALARLSEMQGEVWFKIDRAPQDGVEWVNQIALTRVQVARRLATSAQSCSTWVQTCMFATDGVLPSEEEIVAYIDFLAEQLRAGVPLAGVLLYGLARPSLQIEAPRLSAAPIGWMQSLQGRLEHLGLTVKLSV